MLGTSTHGYGLWGMVAFNVLLFGAFAAGFLRPRRNVEWRTLGVFSAFIVALFAKMYGFPLTIYVLSGLFGASLPGTGGLGHIEGHLLGTLLGLPTRATLVVCQIGGLMMAAGVWIMWKGWKQAHGAEGGPVTDGLYARIRHPQYAGLFVVTTGMLVQWPTLVTLLMWPVLVWAHHRLARREEREMVERFGTHYEDHRHVVPAYLPRRRDRTSQPAAADAPHTLDRRRTTAKGDDPWNG